MEALVTESEPRVEPAATADHGNAPPSQGAAPAFDASPSVDARPPEETPPLAIASTFAEMRLKVGDQVSLEPRHRIAGGRATVKVLGWLEGVSLMVTIPQNTAGRVFLQEDEQVLMRAFTGKSAFAFRTAVLRAAYQPFQYLHIGFPVEVERVQIRNSFRFRVNLPASIVLAGKRGRPGSIVNIGTTGALIETPEAIDTDASSIRITTSFELHGAPVSLDLGATVRIAKSESLGHGMPRHLYGVEFNDLKPNDRLVLGSLLWYHMHEHPGSAA